MIIPLDDTHRIVGTKTCWELQSLERRKRGDEWRPYKYFCSLCSAAREAALAEIRTDPADTLAEAIEAVARVSRKYEQLIDDAVADIGRRADTKLRAVS